VSFRRNLRVAALAAATDNNPGGLGEADRLTWKTNSSSRSLIAAIVAFAMLVTLGMAANSLITPSGSSAATASGGSHSALADLAIRSPDKRVEVIVQLAGGTDAAAGKDLIRAAGGEVTRDVPIIDGMSAKLDAAGAQKLATNPAFRAVSLNAKVSSQGGDPGTAGLKFEDKYLQTSYDRSIHADKAWAAGYTGRGVGVAVIDTGIQGNLPDFQVSRTDPTSRVVATAVVNPGASTAADTLGHGTHVAGLIAGDGTNRSTSDPLSGDYVGVAPDANLIAVKAADDQGNTTVLDVIDGLQFVVDHKADYNIDVVNLSLKSTQAESYKTDPLDAAVEAAWNSGITVVVASGNDGTAADAVDYAPANDPYVITVGGVDDMGTNNVDDDTLASWSSRGTTQDGFAKPDVLAPGAHMISTIPAGADYTQLCPSCMVSGQYFQVGGTSMAAGVASGAVALLIQAHPTWTPDQIKNQLVRKTTAVYSPKATSTTLVNALGIKIGITSTTKTIVGGEITMDKAINDAYDTKKASLNAGLTPNSLIDPATGQIDYSRASWSRASWSDAVDSLRASWSRASWSRASWSRASWSATPDSCAEFERASWSRASWSRASWSRASWSRASWSADGMSSPDLTDVDYSAMDAEIAQAQADCASLLGQVDPTRASWSRASWSRASWSTSFEK
jgi:serine protease AprX